MSQAPLLEIEGLTFQYRRASTPAIRDLTLTLAPGEVLLVAGPSGCGKSTLIRAINGLIPHSYRGEMAGSVRVDGRVTRDLRLRDLASTVGTVLQDPRRQLVASTVEAELAFGPENLGVPRPEIRRRLTNVANRVGITDLLDRTTDELSGGESQQVAIAGALMLEPRLMVLDEPLANLDAAAAERLCEVIRSLADDGTAIVIVEHRVEDVLRLRPTQVLYLEEGTPRYLGLCDRFLEIVDPSRVKVPFEVSLARAHEGRSLTAEPAPPRRTDRDTARPPRLEFQDVRAGYDGREVLHRISAALGARELVAVLGPNGSGKTTLFKAAVGLVTLTGGDVHVDGSSIAGRGVADLASIFGYVFQNPSQMLFAATVRDEILFGPKNLGRDALGFAELLSNVLARVSLIGEHDLLDRPPRTLSFGQQKRLSIAVALALLPRTLVLDEPSAGQDHRTAIAFMEEVTRIEGLESIYFITHDADLALTHADRILLMQDGHVVADGPPLEVIADRERWGACNLRFTSLMEANAHWSHQTGRFLPGDQLAQFIVERSA